jgi:hypothetical protein
MPPWSFLVSINSRSAIQHHVAGGPVIHGQRDEAGAGKAAP